MAHILIIGSGPMGLATAWYALKSKHTVTIVEADSKPGGMAAHFDFDGVSMERFYHFCCRSDNDTFTLLDELDLKDSLRWVSTSMGYYMDGVLHPFGDPLSLLSFKPLSLLERLRYGLMAYMATKRKSWKELDKIDARQWITQWCGERVYQKMWQPLLALKFYEYTDTISAAWVWQRINRLGNSRTSPFQESLGYIEGGSEKLVNTLAEKILLNGGKIHYDAKVKSILTSGKTATGVQLENGVTLEADIICSTAPLPHAVQFLKNQAPEVSAAYSKFKNVGCICVLLKLRQPVSKHFWVNVSDPTMKIPGFVEFSNLRPLPYTMVYIPYYMPANRDEFSNPDSYFIDQSFGYLQKINPLLTIGDVVGTQVSRLQYAQPVCDVGFHSKMIPTQTSIENLLVADTSFYYPEDRGISESIKFSKTLVEDINAIAELKSNNTIKLAA